jgi:hypothetical protein
VKSAAWSPHTPRFVKSVSLMQACRNSVAQGGAQNAARASIELILAQKLHHAGQRSRASSRSAALAPCCIKSTVSCEGRGCEVPHPPEGRVCQRIDMHAVITTPHPTRASTPTSHASHPQYEPAGAAGPPTKLHSAGDAAATTHQPAYWLLGTVQGARTPLRHHHHSGTALNTGRGQPMTHTHAPCPLTKGTCGSVGCRQLAHHRREGRYTHTAGRAPPNRSPAPPVHRGHSAPGQPPLRHTGGRGVRAVGAHRAAAFERDRTGVALLLPS